MISNTVRFVAYFLKVFFSHQKHLLSSYYAIHLNPRVFLNDLHKNVCIQTKKTHYKTQDDKCIPYLQEIFVRCKKWSKSARDLYGKNLRKSCVKNKTVTNTQKNVKLN